MYTCCVRQLTMHSPCFMTQVRFLSEKTRRNLPPHPEMSQHINMSIKIQIRFYYQSIPLPILNSIECLELPFRNAEAFFGISTSTGRNTRNDKTSARSNDTISRTMDNSITPRTWETEGALKAYLGMDAAKLTWAVRGRRMPAWCLYWAICLLWRIEKATFLHTKVHGARLNLMKWIDSLKIVQRWRETSDAENTGRFFR